MLSAAAALLLCNATATAQDVTSSSSESDFRARASVDLSWKPSDNLKVALNEELRMKNSAADFDRIYSTLSVGYKPIRHFEIEGGYTFATIRHDGRKKTDYLPYWDFRHRLFLGGEYGVKLGNWRFSLRERFQATFRTDNPKAAEKSNPELLLRSRLRAAWHPRHLPIEPYAAFELSNTLNAPELAGGNYPNKLRYAAGIKYLFNAHTTLELYYRLDNTLNYNIDVKKDGVTVKSIVEERAQNHIVGLEFGYRF